MRLNPLALFNQKTPRSGDIIFVNRGLYKHYGIYASDACIIHFAPINGLKETDAEHAIIHETTLYNFLKGGILEIDKQDKCAFSCDEIVQRAKAQIGSKGYSIVFNNCEHFARWCKTGVAESKQVNQVADIVGSGISYAIDALNGEANPKDGKKLEKKVMDYLGVKK
jgi:hypothetical protein